MLQQLLSYTQAENFRLVPDLRLLQDELTHIQFQVLDCDCIQYLSQKFRENGSSFSNGRMLTLSPVYGCLGCYCFLVHVSANICPGSCSYHDASSLQRNLVPLSQCLICERSCYRTTLWSFQSFSLCCECEIAVPRSHSVLRIYRSKQFCVFCLASVYHMMAQQPAAAELLLEICVNVYICDEMFSSNLNVVLWMLVWPPLESRYLFILI